MTTKSTKTATAKLVQEVLGTIAEGHTADLAFRATVFAYRLKTETAEALRQALPAKVRRQLAQA